jgi:hypothetical protein
MLDLQRTAGVDEGLPKKEANSSAQRLTYTKHSAQLQKSPTTTVGFLFMKLCLWL